MNTKKYTIESFISTIKSRNSPKISTLEELIDLGFVIKNVKEDTQTCFYPSINCYGHLHYIVYTMIYIDDKIKLEVQYYTSNSNKREDYMTHELYESIKFSYISEVYFYRKLNSKYIKENRKNELSYILFNGSDKIVQFKINKQLYYGFDVGSYYYMETDKDFLIPYSMHVIMMDLNCIPTNTYYLIEDKRIKYSEIISVFPHIKPFNPSELVLNLKEILTKKELNILSMYSL